jgi:hypothetical protein
MDTVTYPDPRVAEFIAEHFVPVKLAIKEHAQLASDYLVSWTPNIVIGLGIDKIHYRIEGYFGPEDFLAHAALGLGKYLLNNNQFDEAFDRFDEVAQRHADADSGAQALYWRGVADYRRTGDAAQLRPSWKQLQQDHSESDWAKRSRVPHKK